MISASCAGGSPVFTSTVRPALVMISTAALDMSSATRTLISDMRSPRQFPLGRGCYRTACPRGPIPKVSADRPGPCAAAWFMILPPFSGGLTEIGAITNDQTRLQLLGRARDAAPRGARGVGQGAGGLPG